MTPPRTRKCIANNSPRQVRMWEREDLQLQQGVQTPRVPAHPRHTRVAKHSRKKTTKQPINESVSWLPFFSTLMVLVILYRLSQRDTT